MLALILFVKVSARSYKYISSLSFVNQNLWDNTLCTCFTLVRISLDECAPFEEVYWLMQGIFLVNSLVNLCFGDASICCMNKSVRRSGFLTFCLDVGGCACLSLSGILRAALCPRIGHYLPSCHLSQQLHISL